MPLKQEYRFLRIATALGPDILAVRSISVQEQLGRLFQIEAELLSEDGKVDLDQVLGHNATIQLQLDATNVRYFNGCVSRLVQVGKQEGYACYRATIVPWLWLLTRTADCRIFQNKTIPDILEEVFKAHGLADYKLNLCATYATCDYCVQYRETDFNFVSRLMEQEGIYYFFVHENGKHTMVLADAISAHGPFPAYEKIRHEEFADGAARREVITDWILDKELQPVAYALNDFDFTKPRTSLRSAANVTRQHGAAQFEIYDYPGKYDELGEGDQLAKIRLEELQTQHETVRARSRARGLAAGYTFELTDHVRSDQNREYLLTAVSLEADAGKFSSGAKGGGEESFSCHFTAVPKDQPFRAPRLTPKPIIQGPQTALVVGPKGEEIHTDKYGRVKVQFHWDRYSKADENSSCWMRVSQPAAGKNWGAINLPRIGQEVIVEFLEGDPDRPIITGRVYNAASPPPYALPDHQTMTTFKSNSSKGGQGFNEIRFEDKKGREQIFIHGEKNLDVRIKNDALEWIGQDRHLVVKRDRLEKVEGDQHLIVQGDAIAKIEGDQAQTIEGDRLATIQGSDHLEVTADQKIKVGGDENLLIAKNWNSEAGQKISVKSGMDLHQQAGMNYAVDAGMAVHIKGGMTVVVEGGTQLSLKVGGNFIDINPGGVFIQGTMVMINSGGAAGSGSGCSPMAPITPEAPDVPKIAKVADKAKPGQKNEAPPAPKPPKPAAYSPAAQVLKSAAKNGTPFCEKCEAAKAAAVTL